MKYAVIFLMMAVLGTSVCIASNDREEYGVYCNKYQLNNTLDMIQPEVSLGNVSQVMLDVIVNGNQNVTVEFDGSRMMIPARNWPGYEKSYIDFLIDGPGHNATVIQQKLPAQDTVLGNHSFRSIKISGHNLTYEISTYDSDTMDGGYVTVAGFSTAQFTYYGANETINYCTGEKPNGLASVELLPRHIAFP